MKKHELAGMRSQEPMPIDALTLVPPAAVVAARTAQRRGIVAREEKEAELARTDSSRRDLIGRINERAEAGCSALSTLSSRLATDEPLLTRLRSLGYRVSANGPQLNISWE